MTSGTAAVTVFGSLHYDITVQSPARPRKGETVTGHSWRPKFGGKGRNQAVAAARVGVRTLMVGTVGDDQFGREMLADLDAHGIDRRFVRVAEGAGSGMSVAIFDAEGDYGAVIVSGANLTLSPADVAAASALWPETAVLVLQNEVPDKANLAAARAARQAGASVILNAAPARAMPDDLAPLVDVLVVNAIEAAAMCGVTEPASIEEAMAAARRLARDFPAAVVTAGSAGVAYAARSDELLIPARAVKVESTHGAGDEFVGHLAASLARGAPIQAALAAANDAAARLVATPEHLRR